MRHRVRRTPVKSTSAKRVPARSASDTRILRSAAPERVAPSIVTSESLDRSNVALLTRALWKLQSSNVASRKLTSVKCARPMSTSSNSARPSDVFSNTGTSAFFAAALFFARADPFFFARGAALFFARGALRAGARAGDLRGGIAPRTSRGSALRHMASPAGGIRAKSDATMAHDFIVHHDLVRAEGASPSRWMLVLHGILGSGANWRTFARRLAAACPDWGFVLVDLRVHGQSTQAPPPHTVLAAAEDLVRLQRHLDLPIRGVLGHSFGGKVALALADINPARLDQVWVLDSQPGANHEELESARTHAVVRMLEEMPAVLPSRERFVEIVEERGYDRTFAAWLAMNLRRTDAGYQLRVDMTAIRALFTSYYETDLWHVVTHHEKARDMNFVVGGKSDVLGEADRRRLAEADRTAPHVTVHTLPEAGHWIHIDDPEGLFAIVRSALCAPAASD